MKRTQAANSDMQADPVQMPAIVIMGVAGSGKTVVGSALAKALEARFVEGDQHHSPENITKMASGLPLSDADREGWLDGIGQEIAAAATRGESVIAACSALKRAYRDRLRGQWPATEFIYLKVERATATKRVAGRKGHFMPTSLVESQFADLEEPADSEVVLTLDATISVPEMVAFAVRRFRPT